MLGGRLSSDDVYSQKDVTDVLKSLSFAVKLKTTYVRSIPTGDSNHHEQRLNIELDTGIVEDKGTCLSSEPSNIMEDMLEKVERMSVAEWAADERRPDGKKQPTKPSRHHDEEFEVLEKDNHSLRLRVEQLQKDVAKAAKDKQRAQDDMDELRQAAHASRHVDALEKELRESRDIIADYERSAKEANQHITQTKQFQQLKKMVGQKNDALKALRKRLLKFEPDADIDDVDDDDDE
ncbi:hypothetical protein DYB28_001098 [Aphanomyces astaci]|uniref:Leucine zipper transcription factor-like protein 1 n=1 Tax=Aphanomyces astaci TaxID=112090 RepID=A0A9X8E152_APHAT|nr:hypothetical protein DYB28_001098 [Aphanomyces astaci]